MQHQTYLKLLSQARRHSRHVQEAEDLLQSALLAAVEAGRSDLSNPQNRRWLSGTLRNQAAFEARSTLRRRARESAQAQVTTNASSDPSFPHQFIDALPRALRTTALLALTGHTRPEIRYLLKISDAALRQRITQIRRRWNAQDGSSITAMTGLTGALPFGLIRRALRSSVQQQNVHLGSHDPDGHLFVLSPAHKTAPRGNI